MGAASSSAAAGDAVGVRADLEHRLRRRPAGDAARAAAEFSGVRYALSVLCFALWMRLARVVWPPRPVAAGLAISGMLMHAGYLGGVWSAVKAGMGAGTVALLVGPAAGADGDLISITASAEHRVTPRQWLGLRSAWAACSLVVWRKLGVGEVIAAQPCARSRSVPLLAITVGTLYQKAPCARRRRAAASAVQLAAALLVSCLRAARD